MPEPDLPHPLHPEVMPPVRRDRTGETGPTKAQAAGPGWRSPFYGWHVPADAPVEDVDQRIVEAAALLPTGGAITGWAALRWAGSPWFDGTSAHGLRRPVPLVVPRGSIRPQPGIVLCHEPLPDSEVLVHDGLRLTQHARSVCFEMRRADSLRDAVVVFDMAAYSDFASKAEVAAYVATIPRRRGLPQCLAALALSDENAWSPMEPPMRMHYVLDAGFPRPLCNQPLFDLTGRHLGTPDLVDVEAGLVCEYDGPLHLSGRRRAKDLTREHVFREVGLEIVTMVAADHESPLTTIVRRMVQTRARARFEPETTRRWTVTPPPWWVDTTTVAARRALSAGQRAKLLRYCRA